MAALALAMALTVPNAVAQWRDGDGKIAADTESSKHAGDFGAMLSLMTKAEYDRFMHEWVNTPQAHGPTLVTTQTARRGDIVHSVITYGGCKPNPDTAACDGTLALRVLKPDGSVYFEQAGIPLAEGVPPMSNVVQLSPVSLAIDFESDDPLGVYLIEVRVEDPGQQVTLDLRSAITLAESTASPSEEP